METRFASEMVATHQAAALAVANDNADLALNNTADFERVKQQFPAESARLKVLWASELIPHGVIVLHRRLSAELRKQVTGFLTQYARDPGPAGDEQRAVLKTLHDFAGFLPAGNQTLVPAEKLYHAMAVQSARTSRWVNEAALQARLKRLESEHQSRLAALNRG